MIVAKVSGAVLADPVALAKALALPGLVAVVHGAGPQLDRVVPPVKVNGLRVTPSACIPAFEQVVAEAADAVAHALTSSGRAFAFASPLAATPVPGLGRTGQVAPVADQDGRLQVGENLSTGKITVFGPIGWGGGVLNVNADDVAQAVACHIGADELIFFSPSGGVQDQTGQTIESLPDGQIPALIQAGIAHGGMVPKLLAVQRVLAAGVPCVRIAAPDHAGTSIHVV